MVLGQGGEAAAAAGGTEPEVPPGREDGAGAVQPCLCPAPGVEAAGAEERRACGCCSGMSWPCCCEAPGAKKKAACPGLGLFYTILSAFLFSVASLFLKKIEDVHSVEVSAFRCVFQMAFILPGLIYYKTGFLGPKVTGVILIARPPFLFGSHVAGIEGSYTNHLKGTIAAITSTLSAASTFVILRKSSGIKSPRQYYSVLDYHRDCSTKVGRE